MTRMQAVTVFAGSDMQRSFSLSFRTLAEGGRRAKRRTALLRAGIACQIWAMSSPRDFIDDSDDYWRRDERTIKLHGPEGFEGMRLAGRLAAETLDFITPYVAAGRQHRRARQALSRLHPRPQGDPRPARLSRLSRSRSAPRSTMWSATASRPTSACRTATSSISTSPPSSTAGTATPAACSSRARSA